MADVPTPPARPTVYVDGELRSAAAAQVPAGDHALLYGLGFFETFRTRGGRPHLWPWHRARLLLSCKFAGIELPAPFLASDEAKLRAVVRRQLQAHGLPEGVFRYTVTAGRPLETAGAVAYRQPSELLAVRPLPPEAPPDGIDLRVLALRRDSGEWLPRPKSLNYANAQLGAQELQKRGAAPADEGLFLARAGGEVVETARQNVAWFARGKWFHPDPTLGAVAGTCLAWLFEQGLAAEPVRASVDGLLQADAVVVMNAVRGITPVRALWDETDREVLGRWRSHAHPRVLELQQWWMEALNSTAAGGD
jgi:4-amino-4-deoxychorismate lyase